MPREFEDIINEWTNTLLERNKTASIDEAILIMAIGPLAQRLIFEAYNAGLEKATALATPIEDVQEMGRLARETSAQFKTEWKGWRR